MNRCKDCRWWDSNVDHHWGECLSHTVTQKMLPLDFQCACSDAFLTGSEFGCTGFTPKDGEA